MIKGNEADLDIESDSGPTQDTFEIGASSNYIRLSGTTVDFSKNSPTDKLKLAFSPTLPSAKLYPLAPVQEILEPAVSPTAIAVEALTNLKYKFELAA